MKKYFLLTPLFICASFALQAEDGKDLNPNLIMFAGEVRTFVSQAKKIGTATTNPSEDSLSDLQATGGRIAAIYFQELNTENKPKIDTYLAKTLKTNPDLKNYFIFIGNAFLTQAQTLIDQYKDQQKKVRRWWTAGGAVIGIVAGGGYLFIKAKLISPEAGLALKDYFIAATAVLGVGAIGYAKGSSAAYNLPVDMSVQNAKDFSARYPHGEDFLKDLQSISPDLAMGLSDIDGAEQELKAKLDTNFEEVSLAD